MTVRDCWIFDLDNTLYHPEECDLFPEMDLRMAEFIAAHLGVDADEASRLRRDYSERYGTTLSGLIAEHGVDPEAFLDDVHRLDLSDMTPSPRLAELLRRLPGRRLVHTNAGLEHAERVLEARGIAHLFDGIFDLSAADYVPKPAPVSYLRLLETLAVDPSRAVMFEDMARNLVPAARLGMTTVWIRTDRPSAAVGPHGHAIDHRADRIEDAVAALAPDGG